MTEFAQIIPDNCDVIISEDDHFNPNPKAVVLVRDGQCTNMLALNIDEAGLLSNIPILTKEGLAIWVGNETDGIERSLIINNI